MRTKPAVPPIAPDDLETLRDGAMTVRQCAEFSGLCRTVLFELMEAGVLPWFRVGVTRMIPRRPVVEYLARAYAGRSGQ